MAKEKMTISGIQVACAFDKAKDVTELVEHPRNPNTHDDKQIALLAKVIKNQGWRAPIVVSKRSGFIVSGHGRLEAAKLLHVEQVPVDFQDFSDEASEYAHLIADNRIAELSEFKQDTIDELLDELNGRIDIELTGFDELPTAEDVQQAVRDFKPRMEFNLVFEDEEQQEAWFGLLRRIRGKYPETETAAAALKLFADSGFMATFDDA